MKSLFTYGVKDTPWLIVITESAGHYYFNKESQESVWQLSSTDILDFDSKVDFNDLSILFAKANGFSIPSLKESHKNNSIKPKRHRLADNLKIDDSTRLSVSVEETQVPPTNEIGPQDVNQEITSSKVTQDNFPIDYIKQQISAENNGLDLGYSSSEDESTEDVIVQELPTVYNENNRGIGNSSDSPLSNEDVNMGLDLGLSADEDEGCRTTTSKVEEDQFLGLLKEFSNRISSFDPWFVVQEELMAELVKRPEYFAVNESSREAIYNKWSKSLSEIQVAQAETIDTSNSNNKIMRTKKMDVTVKDSAQYPDATLLFYKFLQNFKKDVKEQYYGEFFRCHAPELQDLLSNISLPNPEEKYRKFRVVLNDYAKLERTAKKGNNGKQDGFNGLAPGANFKVTHVHNFLANANMGTLRKVLALDDSSSHFYQWVQICNHYNIPPKTVHHPTNFILGDEKRLQCYMEYFELGNTTRNSAAYKPSH